MSRVEEYCLNWFTAYFPPFLFIELLLLYIWIV
nr:MAG TPA: volume-regulated anion channel subunit [Caudoviricetes sp.]